MSVGGLFGGLFGGLSGASIAVAAGAIVVTAFTGKTLTHIGPWYRDLRKPPWNPPNWVFPPAWSTIFLLTAAAAVIAWNAPDGTAPQRTNLLLAVAANMGLNVFWSALFFHERRPDWAQYESVVLWLSIVVLMLAVRALAPAAVWFLVPYLLWVSFATVLNRRIVTLNAPFNQH